MSGGRWSTVEFRVEQGVARVVLNRPRRLNSIDITMHRELPEVWEAVKADKHIRVVVLYGAGEKAFCAGADLYDPPRIDDSDPDSYGADVYWTPRQAGVWQPVICAVNGIAAGGGLHFVADADICIAAEGATFSDPHVSVGLVAGVEPVVLARKIPLESVLRMALMGSGEKMAARRALQIGLISEIVSDRPVEQRALELAGEISCHSPTALAETKRLLWHAAEVPLERAIEEAWRTIARHNRGPDFQEGISAFREKRQPVWTSYNPGKTHDATH